MTLNCAIIGTGHRSTAYVKLINNSNNFKLTYLCDINQERLNDFSLRYNCNEVNKILDYKKLSNIDVDLIFVCTPDYTHYEISTFFLKHGKNLCLEKPICITFEQLESFWEIYNKSSCFVFIPYVLQYTPLYSQMKKLIHNSNLGKILSFDLNIYLTKTHSASYNRRWHRKSSNSGGLFLSKCCHDINLIEWLLIDKIEIVTSIGNNLLFDKRNKTEKNCFNCTDVCLYRYDGNYIYKTEKDIEDPTRNKLDLCVWNDDKDIVDRQSVICQMNSGTIGTINLVLGSIRGTRELNIEFEFGYIKSNLSTGILELTTMEKTTTYTIPKKSGHHGGDEKFMNTIYEELTKGLIKKNNIDNYYAVRSGIICLKTEMSYKNMTHSRIDFKNLL